MCDITNDYTNEYTKDRVNSLLWQHCPAEDQLHAWVKLFLGLHIPRTPVCPHHNAPFDYLAAAYFETGEDLLIWAPRGGGKTRLGAIATLLDLLHKPGISIRILAGSLEQSLRMWEHLTADAQLLIDQGLRADLTSRRITLENGSTAAVLPQSEKAVRGLRIQKLRCDELELFDPQSLASRPQLTTKSLPPNPQTHQPQTLNSEILKSEISNPLPDPGPQPLAPAHACIEALSTLHKPWGLMQKLIDDTANPRHIIKWCILNVLEKCPEDRPCPTCPLWDECQGRAKTHCDGFVSIDDAIALKRRVSKETWDSEMLCLRPSTTGTVFPTFNPSLHVTAHLPPSSLDPSPQPLAPSLAPSLALDFGFHSPFVCLWIATHPTGQIHVLDEYVQSARTLDQHLQEIQSRTHGKVIRITCDPAGSAPNDQTAQSNIALLRRAGYSVKSRHTRIQDGLELIRSALLTATNQATLYIHPRCPHLIRAMQSYRYPDTPSELPLKDGEHDHLIDALRYFFVNRSTGPVQTRRY